VLIELIDLSAVDPKRKSFDRIRAVAHYNAAIETFPETLFPDRFAEANAELAEVLGALALEAPAPFSDAYFTRTLNTYAGATAMFSKEVHPQRWADIHMRVGALFGNRAALLDDIDNRMGHLEQARTCFREAAEVFRSTGDEDHAQACTEAAKRVTDQLASERT
jgi:tetratricopeptide (TPR) repeat protein